MPAKVRGGGRRAPLIPSLSLSLSLCALGFAAVGCTASPSGPAPGVTGSGGSASGTGGTQGTGGGGGAAGLDAAPGGSGGSGGAADARPGSGGAAGGGSGGSSGAGGTGGAGGGQDAAVDLPRDLAPTDVPPAMPLPAVVTYAAHIAPIIASKCSPCHTTEARGGNNWSYATLVTNSTVTSTTAACAPTATATPPPNANRACEFMEGSGKRVVTGPNFELGLMWIKIVGHDGTLCGKACGSSMPPVASGKVTTTYERDVIKKWMSTGAMP